MWPWIQVGLLLAAGVAAAAFVYGVYLFWGFARRVERQQQRIEDILWFIDERRWDSSTAPGPRVGNGKRPPSDPVPPGVRAG